MASGALNSYYSDWISLDVDTEQSTLLLLLRIAAPISTSLRLKTWLTIRERSGDMTGRTLCMFIKRIIADPAQLVIHEKRQ